MGGVVRAYPEGVKIRGCDIGSPVAGTENYAVRVVHTDTLSVSINYGSQADIFALVIWFCQAATAGEYPCAPLDALRIVYDHIVRHQGFHWV